MITKENIASTHKRTYDSLSQYLLLAKKTISKFGPKFYNGLSAEMLKNPDAVSDVATALMYADWKFDPERVGNGGQKKTLYSYRNQCALWAIKTYVSGKYKKQKNMSLDFDIDSDSQKFKASIRDEKSKDPLDILIEQESLEDLTVSVEALLDNKLLSEKQKKQIKMYYFDDKTLSEIGKIFGVSREAVRQNIKRALDIVKAYDD